MIDERDFASSAEPGARIALEAVKGHAPAEIPTVASREQLLEIRPRLRRQLLDFVLPRAPLHSAILSATHHQRSASRSGAGSMNSSSTKHQAQSSPRSKDCM